MSKTTNHYAIIRNDGLNRVEALEVWTDQRDAGHPDVIAEAHRRVEDRGGFARVTWVSVDGACKDGDELDVSDDGVATVASVAAPVFTYTIFDGPPGASGNCAWPSHDGVAVSADSAEDVLRLALDVAQSEGRACGEYEDGDELFVTVWDEDGQIVAEGSVTV